MRVTPGPRGQVVVELRWDDPARAAPFVAAHAFDGRRLRHGDAAAETALAFAEQLQRAADAPADARVSVTAVDWEAVARQVAAIGRRADA